MSTETVTISKEFFDTITDHLVELVGQCLPCGMTVPAADRETVLNALSNSREIEHITKNWPENTPMTFLDYYEGEEGTMPNV